MAWRPAGAGGGGWPGRGRTVAAGGAPGAGRHVSGGAGESRTPGSAGAGGARGVRKWVRGCGWSSQGDAGRRWSFGRWGASDGRSGVCRRGSVLGGAGRVRAARCCASVVAPVRRPPVAGRPWRGACARPAGGRGDRAVRGGGGRAAGRAAARPGPPRRAAPRAWERRARRCWRRRVTAGTWPEALREAARLPGAEGLTGVAACWQVAVEGGAGLAAGLERIAAGLRAQRDQREELRAQLAGPRATALMLALLPVCGLLMGSALGADPLRVLLHTPAGWGCLVVGGLLEWGGVAWTARIVADAMPPIPQCRSARMDDRRRSDGCGERRRRGRGRETRRLSTGGDGGCGHRQACCARLPWRVGCGRGGPCARGRRLSVREPESVRRRPGRRHPEAVAHRITRAAHRDPRGDRMRNDEIRTYGACAGRWSSGPWTAWSGWGRWERAGFVVILVDGAAGVVDGPRRRLRGSSPGWRANEAERVRRLAKREVEADLAPAGDLLAACLAAGAGPRESAEAVGRSLDGPVAERLRHVAAELKLGRRTGHRVADGWPISPGPEALARSMERAGISGVPAVEAASRDRRGTPCGAGQGGGSAGAAGRCAGHLAAVGVLPAGVPDARGGAGADRPGRAGCLGRN